MKKFTTKTAAPIAHVLSLLLYSSVSLASHSFHNSQDDFATEETNYPHSAALYHCQLSQHDIELLEHVFKKIEIDQKLIQHLENELAAVQKKSNKNSAVITISTASALSLAKLSIVFHEKIISNKQNLSSRSSKILSRLSLGSALITVGAGLVGASYLWWDVPDISLKLTEIGKVKKNLRMQEALLKQILSGCS